MDPEQLLRPRRKDLVLAAEDVLRNAGDKLPKKSQLNRLVSVCGEATCAEEIVSYLRYQASREMWTRVFAELVISKIDAPLRGMASDLQGRKDVEPDRVTVAAWRLYAVFLTRAFSYVEQSKKGNGHDRARR